jgi:Flp pilus assembly protein TadG
MGVETALIATVLKVAAATAVIGGTAHSIQQGQVAQKAAEKQSRLQQQAEELQAARQRSDVIRQARIAQAEVKSSAANQGVAGSSMAQGGQGSLTSQMNSNLSFLDGMKTANIAIGQAGSQANQAAYNAQVGQQIAGLGFSAYGNADKLAAGANKAWGKIFG